MLLAELRRVSKTSQECAFLLALCAPSTTLSQLAAQDKIEDLLRAVADMSRATVRTPKS
jgi:hypothetical protein